MKVHLLAKGCDTVTFEIVFVWEKKISAHVGLHAMNMIFGKVDFCRGRGAAY